MKALKITGIVSMCDVANDTHSIKGALLGGDVSTIGIYGGGVMIVDGEALNHGKPYNALASMVAGMAVYGIALIVGADDANDDFDDVPDTFLALLGCGEE